MAKLESLSSWLGRFCVAWLLSSLWDSVWPISLEVGVLGTQKREAGAGRYARWALESSRSYLCEGQVDDWLAPVAEALLQQRQQRAAKGHGGRGSS